MVILWWFYGDSMVIIRWFYADSMLILCWLYGDSMVILWWFYGDSMVILWWFYGDSMVIIWWFDGDSMVILWWLYGDMSKYEPWQIDTRIFCLGKLFKHLAMLTRVRLHTTERFQLPNRGNEQIVKQCWMCHAMTSINHCETCMAALTRLVVLDIQYLSFNEVLMGLAVVLNLRQKKTRFIAILVAFGFAMALPSKLPPRSGALSPAFKILNSSLGQACSDQQRLAAVGKRWSVMEW